MHNRGKNKTKRLICGLLLSLQFLCSVNPAQAAQRVLLPSGPPPDLDPSEWTVKKQQRAGETDKEPKENAAYWAALFHDLSFSGDWSRDLVMVAETQVGYQESQKDHVFERGEWKGYTRYGDWYGVPYGDWCAMFVSFCLNYAGVPEEAVPHFSVCQLWLEELEQLGQTAKPSQHTPRPGDLVFFDRRHKGESGHVGIVRSVYTAENGKLHLETIEGNSGNAVSLRDYAADNPDIMAYGLIPDARVWGKNSSEDQFELPA